MQPKCLKVAAILLSFLSNANAKNFADAETAVKDYAVEGVALGISATDFERKFPSAHPAVANGREGAVQYQMDLSADAVTQFDFYRGRLVAISLVYTYEGNDRVDNENLVAKRLTEVFGSPNRSDAAALSWFFPRVNRAVTCAPSQNSLVVRVLDTSAKR